MNNVLSKKYRLSPEKIERRSLSNEKFGTLLKYLNFLEQQKLDKFMKD